MTTKILIDIILTSEPAKCSSMIQAITFVKKALFEQKREDLFFYWMVPAYLTEDQLQQFPQHPNIRFLPVKAHKDRTKEYLTFGDDADRIVAFNGIAWDFDVLLTCRSGLVPLQKLVMTSPRANKLTWIKEVWLIEEMPLMDFKVTVATFDADVQDRYTINGYLAADKVWLLSYHEKPQIIQRAKDFYAPAMVQELSKKIRPVCTTQFSDFQLKTPDKFFVQGGKMPFYLTYVGRMEAASGIDEINDLMLRHWILRPDVKPIVCTVSSVTKTFNTELVEVKHPTREEFWKIAQEDMHVIIKMTPEGGFTLSLLEPMMFGVPAIIKKAKWATGLLGDDYPFFATGESQVYSICKWFYEDYAAAYAVFRKWHTEKFVPLFQARFKTDLLYDLMFEALGDYETRVPDQFKKVADGRAQNEIVQMIREHVQDLDEFVLFDVIRELGEAGKLNMLAKKTEDNDRDRRGLVWATSWPEWRLILKHFYGWQDASTQTGHLKEFDPLMSN